MAEKYRLRMIEESIKENINSGLAPFYLPTTSYYPLNLDLGTWICGLTCWPQLLYVVKIGVKREG
jgi:hypothetical protein